MDNDDVVRVTEPTEQYPDASPLELDKQGGYYARHVSAMTSEGLHRKDHIAIQLAWRDAEIDRLRAATPPAGRAVDVIAFQENVMDMDGDGTTKRKWAACEAYSGHAPNATLIIHDQEVPE